MIYRRRHCCCWWLFCRACCSTSSSLLYTHPLCLCRLIIVYPQPVLRGTILASDSFLATQKIKGGDKGGKEKGGKDDKDDKKTRKDSKYKDWVKGRKGYKDIKKVYRDWDKKTLRSFCRGDLTIKHMKKEEEKDLRKRLCGKKKSSEVSFVDKYSGKGGGKWKNLKRYSGKKSKFGGRNKRLRHFCANLSSKDLRKLGFKSLCKKKSEDYYDFEEESPDYDFEDSSYSEDFEDEDLFDSEDADFDSEDFDFDSEDVDSEDFDSDYEDFDSEDFDYEDFDSEDFE
jgi:hypothetical protein